MTPLKWNSFYDRFKSTIHDNLNIGDAKKIYFLKGYLKGDRDDKKENEEVSVSKILIKDKSNAESTQGLSKIRFIRNSRSS